VIKIKNLGHPWIFRDSEDGELFTTNPGGETRFIPQDIGESKRRPVLITYPSDAISLRLFALRVISRFADITQLENLPVATFTIVSL
jgi:hypothetical protein